TQRGSQLFTIVGCALCHTPALTTGPAIGNGDEGLASAALSNQQARLFSDLLLHRMGAGLADGITQGAAGPDEFRTAPLWGVGQSEEHTSELQSRFDLVCRLLLEKKKKK